MRAPMNLKATTLKDLGLPVPNYEASAEQMYERFRSDRGGVYKGKAMPPWQELDDETRASWRRWVGA